MRANRGFTLLEVLVAATLTVLLAGLVLAVTVSLLSAWRRAQGGFSSASGAELVLDMVERDLQATYRRPDGRLWLAIDLIDDPALLASHGWVTTGARLKPGLATGFQPWPEPEDDGAVRMESACFGRSGVWLRCLAGTTESSAETIAPRAIAYQVARRPISGPLSADNPAPVRYTLYRSAVNAQATFATGHDLAAAGYQSAGTAPPAQRSPASITNPALADALLSQVVDFGVWLHRRDSSGAWLRLYPSAAFDATHAGRGDAASMPDIADVMIRVLSEEGAQMIENIETGRVIRPAQFASDAEWWWSVAKAHSRVFIRRVALSGAGP